MLTGAAFAAAVSVTMPELPVPGSVTLAVTPAGRPVTSNVTAPVKFVRLTVKLTDCDPPPGVRFSDPPPLRVIAGVTTTVTLKVVATLETPLPLAVTVTV